MVALGVGSRVSRRPAAFPSCILACSLAFALDIAHAAPAGPGRPAATPARAAACPALLDRTHPRLQDDAPQDLCRFAGRVVLVVNTASHCGFTHQYEGLEALYRRYRDRGLVVLGFPSNDFGEQEPGTARQIADLCFNTYGVAFPMFAKTVVAGPKADPLFVELARLSGSPPAWNFHKWLIGRDGSVVAAFPSAVAPLDDRLVRAIERSLGR
ncbi:MAG TPA: glutathione peroxidase [Burkholderiaceae bacterium]|nr:glutathione peroxidase [Burkholderiaceae bacterium]